MPSKLVEKRRKEKKTYKNNNENEKKEKIFSRNFFKSDLQRDPRSEKEEFRENYFSRSAAMTSLNVHKSISRSVFYSFFLSSLHTLLFRAERRKQ
jgi:hypothetical protein